jgi:hypothetical protein
MSARRLLAASVVLALLPAPATAGMFVEFPPRPWAPVGSQFEGNFAESVGPAGDVDADGYGDVIVGADLEDGAFTNEGGAYLYRGGPNGTQTTHSWLWRPGQAEAYGGERVAAAGDVNRDGYADVLVGVASWDTPSQANAGKVAVFHGGPNGLPAAPNYELFSPQIEAGQFFGASIAPAGDVNGDGYDDVVIGTPYNSAIGFNNRGAAHVFHGGPAGLAAAPARSWFGGVAEGQFGISVSGAGDVNADTYADVLVGAPGQFSGAGAAYLFLGSASGVPSGADTVVAGLTGARLGSAVSLAGDVNGDGYGDVLWGSPNANAQAGRVDVGFGGPGGITSSIDVHNGAIAPLELFGHRLATAGDLDGDGLADFLVGATDITNGFHGRVGVYRGGRTNITWVGDIFSPVADGFFGASVATTGDADGDGRAEILIGTEDMDAPPAGQGAGRAFQYGIPRVNPIPLFGWPVPGPQAGTRFGNALAIQQVRSPSSDVFVLIGDPQGGSGFGSVWLHAAGPAFGVNPSFETAYSAGSSSTSFGTRLVDAGDMNRDGYGDFAGSAPTGDNAAVLQAGRVDWFAGGSVPSGPALVFGGAHEFDRVGSALAGRGDVNGDGYHDLLIGAREWDSNGLVNRGAAWVVLGGPTGPAASPAWTRQGAEAGAGLGAGVAFADLDADGYSDVVVGSNPAPPSGAVSGKVEVFYGGPGGTANVPGLVLTPTTPRPSFGGTVAAIGDVTGDGLCDLAVGSPGDDGARGRVDVYAGTIGRSQSNIPIWKRTGTIVDGRLGAAIAGGGDVDGDGFGDFVIGEPGYGSGEAAEGRLLLFYGAPFAPGATPWTYEPDIVNAQLGSAFAPLRDVNRDGTADLLVGAPSAAGRVYVFLGLSLGAHRKFQVLEPNLSPAVRFAPARLAAPGHLAFVLSLRSAAGRSRVGHDFEIRTLDEPFTNVPTHPGANNTFDTGTPGSINESFPLIDHPFPGAAYHVRARLRGRSPYFQRSKWLTPEAHTSGDHDAWLAGTNVDVPGAVVAAVDVPRLTGVTPNPASAGSSSRVAFALPRAARVTLDVFDVRGARVRRLIAGEERPAGTSSTAWDGRDDRGRAVPPGLYFLSLAADGQANQARTVRLP